MLRLDGSSSLILPASATCSVRNLNLYAASRRDSDTSIGSWLPATDFKLEGDPHFQTRVALLPAPCSRVRVVVVRFLAIILVALLLPCSMSAPSATACPTMACCGTNCSRSAPVNQLRCCQPPAVPDKATNQARGAQHCESIRSLPVTAVIAAISHVRSSAISHGYTPPHSLRSLALLCSRQI